MNILVLTHQTPLPVNHGSAHRMMGQARALAGRGHAVTILALSDSIVKTRSVFPYEDLERLEVIEVPGDASGMNPVTGVLQRLLPGKSNMALLRQALKLRATRKIDVIQLDRPYMLGVAQMLRKTGIPLVYIAHFIEQDAVRDLYAMGESTQKDVLETAKIERKAVLGADLVLAVSKRDANLLEEYYGTTMGGGSPRIDVCPNGVDTGAYRDIKPFRFLNPAVVFVGSGIHYPNRDALWRLYNTIIPQVRRRHRQAEFVFIGPDPPEWLKEQDGIRVLGEVDDVRPYILGARVCVAPIRYGSGSPTKVLEYMAAGKGIVATPEACNALGLKEGIHALIRAREEDFSQAVVELVRSRDLTEELGRSARSLAAAEYDWQRISVRIEGLYNRLIAVH